MSLARSIDTWLDLPEQKSGLSSRERLRVTNAMRKDTSELYPPAVTPPQEMPPTAQSGAPPTIAVVTPAEKQILGLHDKITGPPDTAPGPLVVQAIDRRTAERHSGPTRATRQSGPLRSPRASRMVRTCCSSRRVTRRAITRASRSTLSMTALGLRSRSFSASRRMIVCVRRASACLASSTPTQPLRRRASRARSAPGAQTFYTYADLYDAGSPVFAARAIAARTERVEVVAAGHHLDLEPGVLRHPAQLVGADETQRVVADPADGRSARRAFLEDRGQVDDAGRGVVARRIDLGHRSPVSGSIRSYSKIIRPSKRARSSASGSQTSTTARPSGARWSASDRTAARWRPAWRAGTACSGR